MKKQVLFLIIIIIAFTGLAYYLNSKSTLIKTSNKLQVVASFYPMYFFATQIGGDKASVFNITPASAEPHDYEPTTRDIARIEKSNLLILNGGSIESWGNKIKDELQGKQTIVIAAGDKVATKQLDGQGKIIRDPHVWLDPLLAIQEIQTIEKGFEKVSPKDAMYFKANAKILEDKLTIFDAGYKLGLSNCKQKDFVTSHAAFAYLAQRYGINQIAISGLSPDEEPSSKKLAEITNLVKQKHIKVIFFESLVSPKLSQTIANETNATSMVLDPIEGISDDNIKAGHTYLTVMKENLLSLQTALQCNK